MPWELFVRRPTPIYLWIILKALFTRTFINYLIFIDDIFFIWTGSKEQLIWKLDELNTKHDPNKSEYKTGYRHVYQKQQTLHQGI